MIPPQNRPPGAAHHQAFGWDDPSPPPGPAWRVLRRTIYAAAMLGLAICLALPFLV